MYHQDHILMCVGWSWRAAGAKTASCLKPNHRHALGTQIVLNPNMQRTYRTDPNFLSVQNVAAGVICVYRMYALPANSATYSQKHLSTGLHGFSSPMCVCMICVCACVCRLWQLGKSFCMRCLPCQEAPYHAQRDILGYRLA